MARILVVYHRDVLHWRSTYRNHLESFRLHPEHEVLFLNAARPAVPRYIASFDADLIIFHYTFMERRMVPSFPDYLEKIEFAKHRSCEKAMIVHDEQIRAQLLCQFVRDFGVSVVFSTAPPSEWPKIYRGLDNAEVSIHTVLSGYVDDSLAKRLEKRAGHMDRPVDIGYRSSALATHGRHGMLKQRLAEVFQAEAPLRGLVVDVSARCEDGFVGKAWFDFLLKCKYVVAGEAGSSILDWDGTIEDRTFAHLREHPTATFEQLEAACFPGVDGNFDYRLISCRHIEAVMTKTCQILVEGEYCGVLKAGRHYIELKRDFSNLDCVLSAVEDDGLRARIVEQAYHDIVLSGKYSYRAFARRVVRDSLGGAAQVPTSRLVRLTSRALSAWNAVDDYLWVQVTLRLQVWVRQWVQQAKDRYPAALYAQMVRVIGKSRTRSLVRRLKRHSGRSS